MRDFVVNVGHLCQVSIQYEVRKMNRAPIELFYEWFKEKGVEDPKKIREIINSLLEKGVIEGNDEEGYVLTTKGVIVVEKDIFGSYGVI